MSSPRTHLTADTPQILRHDCTLCGGCCEGVRVPLFDEAQQRVANAAGTALGIPDAVDGNALRMVDGRCVFLRPDNRCMIHAELGGHAKPTPCQQFPLVVLRAEDMIRIAVDPASYGARASFFEGTPLPDGPLVATHVPVPGGQLGVEQALVALCERPGTTTLDILRELTREADPLEGFATRWGRRLVESDLHSFIARKGPGPRLKAGLSIIANGLETPVSAPVALPPHLDQWVVEATRRVLLLRLQPSIPSVAVSALFVVGGGLAAGWFSASDHEFDHAFTAWMRSLRFDVFWHQLAGDAPTLHWLATGQEAN